MSNWTDWQKANSSNVEQYRYNEDTKTLQVEFKPDGTYEYNDVPVTLFEDMKTAPSKGKFLHTKIKGKFDYTRL